MGSCLTIAEIYALGLAYTLWFAKHCGAGASTRPVQEASSSQGRSKSSSRWLISMRLDCFSANSNNSPSVAVAKRSYCVRHTAPYCRWSFTSGCDGLPSSNWSSAGGCCEREFCMHGSCKSSLTNGVRRKRCLKSKIFCMSSTLLVTLV